MKKYFPHFLLFLSFLMLFCIFFFLFLDNTVFKQPEQIAPASVATASPSPAPVNVGGKRTGKQVDKSLAVPTKSGGRGRNKDGYEVYSQHELDSLEAFGQPFVPAYRRAPLFAFTIWGFGIVLVVGCLFFWRGALLFLAMPIISWIDNLQRSRHGEECGCKQCTKNYCHCETCNGKRNHYV